jgi:hypothetical protein
MSVQVFRPPHHPDAWVSEPFRSQPCFYCGQPLSTPFVIWMGVGEPLALHPACVVELSIRLLRDVWQIETATNTYITSRTTPELRERLRAEEGLR